MNKRFQKNQSILQFILALVLGLGYGDAFSSYANYGNLVRVNNKPKKEQEENLSYANLDEVNRKQKKEQEESERRKQSQEEERQKQDQRFSVTQPPARREAVTRR